MNPDDHDGLTGMLGREMHDQVDRISGTPISLDDVKGTAGRIRRRRTAAIGGGVVAAALAILIPTSMLGSGIFPGDAKPDPAAPERIEALDEPVLLTDDAPEGGAPTVPYLNGEQLLRPDSDPLELGTTYDTLTPTGDEFLAVRRGDPDTEVDVLDAEGNVLETSITTGTPVSSPDKSVAAWATPAGKVMTRSEGRTVELAALPRAVQAVEILGSGPCDSDEGCRVFYNEVNRQLAPGAADADGTVNELGGDLRSVSAVSLNNLVGGVTTDPDSDPADQCSALYDEEAAKQLFDTCDYIFGIPTTGFSPDGSTIVAERPDEYGASPDTLALLDSRSGDIRAEIRVPSSESDAVGRFVDSHWEDSDHLLVKTEAPSGDADFGYTVFRISLDDGSVEKLLHSVVGGGGTQPFMLPN